MGTTPLGYAEIALQYGQSFTLTEQFDLELVADTIDSPAATQQWVDLMLATNPRLFNSNNVPIARGDDICNQDFGGGLRALVGSDGSNDEINERIASIQAQLAANPNIAQNPVPIVTITLNGPTCSTYVKCYTANGLTVISNYTTNIFGG